MNESVIYRLLNANATFSNLIGTDPDTGGIKLYHAIAPQGTQKPYAVYTLISGTNDMNKDEDGFRIRNIQIDFFANNADSAESIGSAAHDVLNRYKGTIGGLKIASIRGDELNASAELEIEASHRTYEYQMYINPE